jgi:hypothetical protein
VTTRGTKFAVVEVPQLAWPAELQIPSKRFRLLVAADTSQLSVQTISDFALASLEHGMVYFVLGGPAAKDSTTSLTKSSLKMIWANKSFPAQSPVT